MKVIRQGIVLYAQILQDALGLLIDVLEPDWGMPEAVKVRPVRDARLHDDTTDGGW